MSREIEPLVPTPDRALSLSISDLQRAAASGAVPVPRLLYGQPTPAPPLECGPSWGRQEIVNLSDDLLLVRSEVHSNQLCENHGALFEIDTRGWLYLHFRLDGVSLDRLSDGSVRTVSGGSFLICSSPRPSALARQVLSDTWRVVSVACRPSDMLDAIPVSHSQLPEDLRRFRAGDPEADFFYASLFTPDMRLAAGALSKPAVVGGMQPFYLRAKAVELVCLAVEHIGQPSPEVESPLKLSHRDIRSLENIKRFIETANQNYSLEQLARHAGVNRRKLALGFKLVFGVPPGEYQRDVRLEKARRMLDERIVSVAYAATAAGYSDLGSFGKAFKARYGTLPSRCRISKKRAVSKKK